MRDYYIAMEEDASLSIIPVAETVLYPPEDIFGPYRTHKDASEAAAHAEFDLYTILTLAGR